MRTLMTILGLIVGEASKAINSEGQKKKGFKEIIERNFERNFEKSWSNSITSYSKN